MNILIFGATGMVGQGALRECLVDPAVTGVTIVVRAPTGRTDPKLREIVLADLGAIETIAADLTGFDACIYAIGVTSIGMAEADYARLTHDLTLKVAGALSSRNPQMTFLFVSAQGTDSSESGRLMWARVKGRTENALMRLPFRAAYMFRPGAIQPLHGIRSKTGWYRWLYAAHHAALSGAGALLSGLRDDHRTDRQGDDRGGAKRLSDAGAGKLRHQQGRLRRLSRAAAGGTAGSSPRSTARRSGS
ncbi:MAG: epimerase [Piscinibacter sp.]